jgi:type I restriction enzyme, S subunit
MSGWGVTTLTDLCSDISYGYTASAKQTAGGPKFLRITDIVPDRINWDEVPYCNASEKDVQKYKLRDGDIVVARTGATTGYNKLIRNISFDAVYASYLIRYEIDRSKAIPDYVRHVLQSSAWYDYIDAIAGGSAQPGANAKQLGSFELLLPSLPEQKAIAAVLGSLDDKIDLLHRQNKTLEAMAASLFRQWFVEEAQGDWEARTLDDVISVKGGTTPSTKEPEYWDGIIRWSTPRDLSSHDSVYLFDTERKITDKGLAQIGSGLLPVGTVLLSSRAPIGYLAIADIPVAINQGYIAIVCDKLVSNFFMYLWCLANMDAIKSAGNGSTFEEISKSNFKALPLNIPTNGKLMEFDKVIAPTFEKIKTNQKQIRTLEKLRNTLLPKLMSGEVRVEV